MNTVLPITTFNQHYKISNKQQKKQMAFTGGNKELLTTAAAGAITSIIAADVEISKARKPEEKNYKARLQSLQEKLIPLTETKLSTDYLLTQCKKPMADNNNDSSGFGRFNQSAFIPESLELVEQFVDNEPLYTNDNLCNGVMDRIVTKLAALNFSYNKNNKIKVQDYSKKIKLIANTYISNPDCQKSEPMKKNIAFLMYRVFNADDETINQAIKMMSDPKLYNDDEYVSHITYQMKKERPSHTSHSELNKRIDCVKEKMDSIESYRYFDMKLGNIGLAKEHEINGLNVDIVEKFLNEDKLKNNPIWEKEILTILSSLNTMIYGGTGNIHDVNVKIKQINDCMNRFLEDETDMPEDEKAQKYIDGITYY